MVPTLESHIAFLSFGVHSLDMLVSSLEQNHMGVVSFSTLDTFYSGEKEKPGIGTIRYPLIIAGFYGAAYATNQTVIPEGIALAQFLRKHEGLNKETPLFLVHYGLLSAVEQEVIQQMKSYDPLHSCIRNSQFPLTVFYDLSDSYQWQLLLDNSREVLMYHS